MNTSSPAIFIYIYLWCLAQVAQTFYSIRPQKPRPINHREHLFISCRKGLKWVYSQHFCCVSFITNGPSSWNKRDLLHPLPQAAINWPHLPAPFTSPHNQLSQSVFLKRKTEQTGGPFSKQFGALREKLSTTGYLHNSIYNCGKTDLHNGIWLQRSLQHFFFS